MLARLLLLLSLSSTLANNPLGKIVQTGRRILNFSHTFGSAHSNPIVYDRVAGHPVFGVTTPYGSPYMSMEKLSDLDEVVQEQDGGSSSTPQSLSEEQNEYRTVVLYFLDPDDALSLHGEMKQMESMENTDLRITSSSLAKALRQSSQLNHGLVTGAPPDPLTGKLQLDQGGALRYKVVPPKRQLYYAARCKGKERVGLWSESNNEDAATAIVGNSALEAMVLGRRREKRERKTAPKRTPMQLANAHMEGYVGIPVFYCEQMHQKLPWWKQVISGGNRNHVPLFFNYEDLVSSWSTLTERNGQSSVPAEPNVEVFNLWDVLTSMDRQKSRKRDWKEQMLDPIKQRVDLGNNSVGLDDIVFIPSSRSINYKESISARGNGKARLRPMR